MSGREEEEGGREKRHGMGREGERGEGKREMGSNHWAENGTRWPFPSSLSFLISLKERRSVECKRANPNVGQGEWGHQVRAHTGSLQGHFGTGRGSAKSTVKDICPRIKWGHLGYLERTLAL